MKIFKNTAQFGYVIILLLATQGQSCIGDRYMGPMEKETRNVSGFNAIEVGNGIDVNISLGSNEYVEVEAAEDLLEHVVTEVKGGTLKIYFDNLFNWSNQANVFVQALEIETIHASSGSDVRCEDVLETKELKLRASGGSDIRLEVMTENLEVDVSGGAEVLLIGSTEYINAETSGGSDLKAQDLIAQAADLVASGGSDIKIHVEKELNAKASGGADIIYTGNPSYVNSDTSAGGDITRRN